MEIRDPVHGSIALSAAEEACLESREFQRLRQIKQLGFAEYSFPGGTHTRFLHSVGVMHLAGLAFDAIFSQTEFSKPAVRSRLRQAVRLAALLHDIGHGPLSHTTEHVMPLVGDLKIKAYQQRERGAAVDPKRKATHEDYTIRMVTDSELAHRIGRSVLDTTGLHIAQLIDRGLKSSDDFFVDRGLDYRPVLSQVVSSEMDVDRMDYLVRDAYFTGTNYGRVELEWLIRHLTCVEQKGKLFLGLNRRALYTFDDFLISRHHVYLMVYFHHKSIVYEEMLGRYLESKDCTYALPSDPEAYLRCTDFSLYEHLAQAENSWAKRISNRTPYRMISEIHSTEASRDSEALCELLEKKGIDTIHSSSKTRLSKYHATQDQEASPIFVVNEFETKKNKATRIENVTRVFSQYEETRVIERVYVSPENDRAARQLMLEKKLNPTDDQVVGRS